ncbi:common plant regulatory factor 1-like [Andrographis paniculata]|uniref:common plant regulatory factor 1-like n=1 Tax=Andrographis paniculata TaxID=175694 RepID=UPI0021E93630|nr:common plant regulatory factor 1-like [Andrographis paniculata]XP_051145509.1 common plant regulatory factor 1-like [Andrographis paniculata]XP_051145510.1 common plant regulatory factor 1-like [Andrographis paniculata]
MEHSEEGQPLKPEKSSSPAKVDQNSIPTYPDWAAMQAYYGSRFAIPYVSSAVASPHGHQPYLWVPPQSMIPPYGAPYAAFYAPGGFFGHTGVPIAGAGFSADTSVKIPGNTDEMKKSKDSDPRAKSKDSSNADSGEHGTDHRLSESEDTGGSSDGSNGVTHGVDESGKKRSRQGSPSDGEAKKKQRAATAAEGCRDSGKAIELAKTPVEKIEKSDSPLLDVKLSPTNTPYPSINNEALMQNERELKRERRKQSNRESARRSRLRKQAEMEELTGKVQVLTSKNMTLKSEINKLMLTTEKLKLENVDLMEKLKAALKERAIDNPILKPDGTQNLLERVNKNTSNDDGDSFEKSTPMAKLHQLLDPSHRSDAVAAS